jgi:hypothetical protein
MHKRLGNKKMSDKLESKAKKVKKKKAKGNNKCK